MLDAALLDQVKTIFEPIETSIEFFVDQSAHASQNDLITMLTQLCQTNSNLTLKYSENQSPIPHFTLRIGGKASGVHFKGIPGGHEFSSLLLAILNSAGQGKMPDALIIKRIKRLPGPIHLQTYISLTCENCPDVVQALNQITLIHGNMSHTMIDGAYVQEDVDRLNIQGVPSVVLDNKLIHAGKASFSELLVKLETQLGSQKNEDDPGESLGHFNIAVLGGGPSGVAAAIYSARKGLKTILIAEKIGGQVQETKGIENLISVIYTEGPQLSDNLEKHLKEYPVALFEHRRVESIAFEQNKASPFFNVHLESKEYFSSEQVIVATGAKWRELNIPGEKEYLGRGVAFCPHCDGPYYKGKKVAVVGGGNSGVEAAIDLAGICSEVVLLEFQSQLKADQILIDKLKTLPNASILTNVKIEEIKGDGQKVTKISYRERATNQLSEIDLAGIFVQIGLVPNSAFIKKILETNAMGEIVVDQKGRTSVKGIYAAGDVTTTPYKQIVIAMGEGAKAALAAFEDRLHEKYV